MLDALLTHGASEAPTALLLSGLSTLIGLLGLLFLLLPPSRVRAEQPRRHKGGPWRRWGASAAAVLVLLGSTALVAGTFVR
ncbi:MAG TPA: hypothetical protein VFK80_07455 [Limnochordia bacterium]|nr:hypothetical protein [Limnochordia bacterium]